MSRPQGVIYRVAWNLSPYSWVQLGERNAQNRCQTIVLATVAIVNLILNRDNPWASIFWFAASALYAWSWHRSTKEMMQSFDRFEDEKGKYPEA